MNKYLVEVVDYLYVPKGTDRILLASTRRKAVEHLATEYGIKLSQHQNSLGSFNLPNGDIVFISSIK